MAQTHEHVQTTDTGSGMGFFLGILLLIIFLALLFYYGLPLIQQGGGTQLNIPNRFNVDIQQK